MKTCRVHELDCHAESVIPQTIGFVPLLRRIAAGIPRLHGVAAPRVAVPAEPRQAIKKPPMPLRFEDYERRGSGLGDLLGGQIFPGMPSGRDRL